MQDIQFKANSGQFNIDQAQGIVECFVAGIGNKDSVGDIVISGAFAKSLMRRKPRVVWGHNWNDPIGKVIEIYEVPPNDQRLPQKMKMAGIGGLYAKVQFNLNSEKGREAFANVAFFGEEQEWSIGYKTLDAIYDNSKQANILREVELYELSPVLHGANQLTGTISVKSDEEKMHGMHMGMGMPTGMVAVAEKPKGPSDPFAQGVAQPADSDRIAALERELTSRTGGPVKVMKANESSVVFLKAGKGMFRLGYYFDGEQFMFGKPEKLGAAMVMQPVVGQPKPGPKPERIPNFPNVQQKPSSNAPIVPVKYGSEVASGFFDLDSEKSLAEEMEDAINGAKSATDSNDVVAQLSGIVGSLQNIINQHQSQKTDLLIQCPPELAFETKQALDPVFDYHRIESYVTEDGIVIASPLTGDAYEAVENATKSLLGRIGRGIGSGGKGRRGRAALARIEGVLDPRNRRDVDGDGLIFDGTWMEQPDPTRFAPSTNIPRRGLRSEGPEKNYTPNPKWRGPKKVSESIDVLIGRAMNKKITEMFDDLISKNQIPDENIVAIVAKGFKKGVRDRELINPDVTPEQLEQFKSEFERLREKFAESGALKPGQKGTSPFEVLDEIVKTGKYRRVNKKGPRAGEQSATAGKVTKGRTVIVGTDQKLPTIKENSITKKLDVSEFIEAGLLPKNWESMSGDEQVNWIGENEDSLLDLAGKQRPFRWQKTVRRITDSAFDKFMKESDRSERQERARTSPKPEVSKPQIEKPETPKKKPLAEKPKNEESDSPTFSKFNSVVGAYVGRNREKLSPGFASAYDDLVDNFKNAITDEDGNETEETLKNAQEVLEEGLISLSTTMDTEDGDITRKERKLNKQERQILEAVQVLSSSIGDTWRERLDREEELDADADMQESLSRRARRARQFDAEDDEDAADGADYENEGMFDASRAFSDFEEDYESPASFSMARKFQSSHRRRKSNGGLRSSGKQPRTEVTNESTWWKKIGDSLGKEIREADNDLTRDGLNLLQEKIKKYEAGAFTPNSRRTNVGSIKITADEADKILDAVMAVIDRQKTAGKRGSVGSRGEIFAELLEMLSKAAMSTFIDKTSSAADDK